MRYEILEAAGGRIKTMKTRTKKARDNAYRVTAKSRDIERRQARQHKGR